MSTGEILANINKEDVSAPGSGKSLFLKIEKLVGAITDKMLAGGRLLYRGRHQRQVGYTDSEIPPTYGLLMAW